MVVCVCVCATNTNLSAQQPIATLDIYIYCLKYINPDHLGHILSDLWKTHNRRCRHISSRTCSFIDFHLQPYANKHPSCIKDFSLIQKIEHQTTDPNYLLISADVESLYTNLHHDLIIQYICEAWNPDNNPSTLYENLLEVD